MFVSIAAARIGGIIRLPDDGRFIADGGNVAVEAVFGDVEFSAGEPFHIGAGEVPLQDFAPFFSPREMTGLLRPEVLGVGKAFLILCAIAFYIPDAEGHCKNCVTQIYKKGRMPSNANILLCKSLGRVNTRILQSAVKCIFYSQ